MTHYNDVNTPYAECETIKIRFQSSGLAKA